MEPVFADLLRLTLVILFPAIVAMAAMAFWVWRKQDAWPREAKLQFRRKADGRGRSRLR